ncbi:hypothetical protein V2J09_010686 [Rumex salicifolius]
MKRIFSVSLSFLTVNSKLGEAVEGKGMDPGKLLRRVRLEKSAEVRKAAEGAVGDLAKESSSGKAELGDVGAGGVAVNAVPVTGEVGGVPLDVYHASEELMKS